MRDTAELSTVHCMRSNAVACMSDTAIQHQQVEDNLRIGVTDTVLFVASTRQMQDF
jgi:hypothetical protein